GSVGDIIVQKQADRLRRTGHIGTFTHGDAAVINQNLCIISIQFILSSAGKSQITVNVPDIAIFDIFSMWMVIHITGEPTTLDLFDLNDGIDVDAMFINDDAVRVRAGNDFGTNNA